MEMLGNNFAQSSATMNGHLELHSQFAVTLCRALTPAQVALAWLLAQGPDTISIPGTNFQVDCLNG
ncbi:hypothetical protein N7535_008563 [Penicillium sp. DV-2018c]|nr:hypothetical protein N7461_002322 [Penicillium sp. DV-2018c]KAJ5563399.1 hypothetical protein N7535_008563 [Penicillium sp. DV-2018c]